MDIVDQPVRRRQVVVRVAREDEVPGSCVHDSPLLGVERARPLDELPEGCSQLSSHANR